MRRTQMAIGAVTIALATLVAASLALASDRHDGKNTLTAQLIGFEEVPSVNTPGHATLKLTLASDRITFQLDYAALTGPPQAAHIHVGQRGVNGGVSVFFCGGGGKPACPASNSGSISGTIVAADVIGPVGQGFNAGDLAAVENAIQHGVTYANMHTAKFPGGEIRAQLRDKHGDNGEHGDRKD